MKPLVSPIVLLSVVGLLLPGQLFASEGNQAADSSGTMEKIQIGPNSWLQLAITGQPLSAGPTRVIEGPTEQTHCSANLDCGDQVISCTGHSSCSANPFQGTVTCDGQVTTCPNRCEVWVQCCWDCYVHCTSNSGDCVVGSDYVQCNGGFVVKCADWCWGTWC